MRALHATARETRFSLWVLTGPPVIWGAHFLLSYTSVAVWCARAASQGATLGTARWAIVAYTGVALVGIGLLGARAWRRRGPRSVGAAHDEDSSVDRARFLALATLLLAGLSAVAVLYASLPALFMGTCL
jgi:hypothetical protein